jgi:hypothetical protein
MTDILPISRRTFGTCLGALVATFPLKPRGTSAQVAKGRLEGWIRVASDNTVTVFTGKAELGQGILTALAQIAAEELDVDVAAIRMVSADTSRGPDESYTYGSQSVEQSGPSAPPVRRPGPFSSPRQRRASTLTSANWRLNRGSSKPATAVR